MAEIDYTALTHALLARRFLPQVFDTAAEAKAAALQIIGKKSVGIGGSATVRDMGLAEALQANGNQVYWHWLVAKEAKQAARDKALTADVYLSSTNALITDGRLVNIDGTGNRVAGSLYGHRKVYFVAGRNKIAPTLQEAAHRARNVAAPLNAARHQYKTPCAMKQDRCYDCKSPDRICSAQVIYWRKMNHMDMEVALIDEGLGF